MADTLRINTTDRQTFAITQRERTDQGYLKVPGRVARTGVQDYLASELGLDDRDKNEIVRVYRPPEEVFSDESLSSYENADVTDDHPPTLVDAETYRQYAKGHTLGPGRAEGDYVVVDLLIKDKDAIDAVEAGKTELSAGYENEYSQEPGISPDGTEYEFVQRGIRINHIALVDRGRAGKEAKLFDNDRSATMSTITLDGKTVKVGDEATAQLIQHTLDEKEKSMHDMEEKVKKAKDEYEEVKKEMDEMKAEKDAAEEERDEYKEKASEDALSERLREVSEVKDAAVKIAGESFTSDSIDPLTIKREAMKVVRPSIDWDSQSEHYVAAAWDIESTKDDAERTNDAASRSHDALSGDLANLYTNDGGEMKGSAEYQKFLSGGTH